MDDTIKGVRRCRCVDRLRTHVFGDTTWHASDQAPYWVTMDPQTTVLPRVIDAPDGKPIRPEAPDNQRLMAEIRRDPSTWTPDLAKFTTDVFDALSTNWVNERGGYRSAPLIDALDRGHLPRAGRCLEIGSGTGILTPYLAELWGELICVDLSLGMMSHQRYGSQVQADANNLPFADAAFSVVVIGDGPLFAAETVRLLAQHGALIWSNALGAGAPYFQPTDDIRDALTEVAPESSWSAVESEALWGSWAVFRRSVD
jgi:SAM-dependent methyltransferase